LLAVAAASAGQTAILAFLPSLVADDPIALSLRAHDFHVASLTAVHPLAALLLAPLWGWLADRVDYRIILRAALLVLALATAPIGAVNLPTLYLLRMLAGMAAAAIIPLALLSASFAARERSDQARRFTWLTAFVFLGDLMGPLLAQSSVALTPRTPLLVVAVGVAAIAMIMCLVNLPARCMTCPDDEHAAAPSLSTTVVLLLIAIVGGGGLAAIHVNLLMTRVQVLLGREAIAWMLSLCGFGMLVAQLFHTRVAWLVTMPRRLAGLTLALLAAALFVFQFASTATELAAIIVAAGWSSASLRLVTSFWISGTAAPSGSKLGLQHAAASIGQALAPMVLAVAPSDYQPAVLWVIGGFSLLLVLSLPVVWRSAVPKAGWPRR
jgi:MFS family permease